MRSEERMSRFWRWLFAAAVFAIGYGLLQYFDSRFYKGVPGIDPFIWRQAFSHRVFSTFGNPNFYGNFLVIVTPFILAFILKAKGSLIRPFVVVLVTLGLVLCIDKMTLGLVLGADAGFDPSYKIVAGFGIVFFFGMLLLTSFWGTLKSKNLWFFLMLLGTLFLNLYSTETKGAWLGFVAAVAITMLLIFEFFLHPEETIIPGKTYMGVVGLLIALFVGLFAFMGSAFIIPIFKKEITQVGFSIFWIPVAVAFVMAVLLMFWILQKPWNLKKAIYGFLLFFVLAIGGFVLQYAKTRLVSVSFRLFTWIGTWEMVRTAPILGNGVGTFKVIYPAYRRPQIIILEGKSNTETDHAEDEYIEIWQDEGIIGFGIFLWMMVFALVCGIKQLRWYSKIRPPPDARRKKKFLEIEADPRSYEVLGIVGAYCGALTHWAVDVSIRFVSSGVFSGLLPGLLVAYARNHREPIRVEPRLSYERWIRVGLAAIWTFVFLILKMEFVPQTFIQAGDTTTGQIVFFALLVGLGLYILIELLEIGLAPKIEVPFSNQYPPGSDRFVILRLAVVGMLAFFLFETVKTFKNFFDADVHHNLAIFFSKQGIWRKEPKFLKKVQTLPPDIKEKYEQVGGALEHYEQVIKKNPGFPMARYFTGNVHNDAGSQVINLSFQAHRKGNRQESSRLRSKAIKEWNLAEQAYDGTKLLGPNYVQVHHQMGLLNLKRAQAAAFFGDHQKAQVFHNEALKNFELYNTIDPVFPPNYHRMVEIHLARSRFDEAERLYKEAIHYNDVVSRQIFAGGFSTRVADFSVSLGRVYFTHASKLAGNPFNPVLPEIKEAIKYFELAMERNPKNVDGFKGAGRIYGMMGRHSDAQRVLRKALELSPNDPDLKSITQPS